MKGTKAIETVALAQGYANGTAMLLATHVEASTIDDDDERTWPERKVERNIIVQCLSGGGFTVREGDRFCDRLGWDEMIGHLASMTIPPGGRMYPMVTKAEEDAEIERRIQKRKERDAQNQATTLTP